MRLVLASPGRHTYLTDGFAFVRGDVPETRLRVFYDSDNSPPFAVAGQWEKKSVHATPRNGCLTRFLGAETIRFRDEKRNNAA